jgi:hypothetical protein
MAKNLSGRVKKTPPTEVSAERYNYIGLSETEPDLGIPFSSDQVLTSSVQGVRSWVSSSTLQGTSGTQGTAGSGGSQGTTGSQGLLGAQGIQGTVGLQGIQGIIGDDGFVAQSTPPTNTSLLWLDTVTSATISGVNQIVAGTNVTISPTGGTGAVTINATGGGSATDSDQNILAVQIFG